MKFTTEETEIDDVSAIEECAHCEWSPAAILLTNGNWKCYNCGGDVENEQ